MLLHAMSNVLITRKLVVLLPVWDGGMARVVLAATVTAPST